MQKNRRRPGPCFWPRWRAQIRSWLEGEFTDPTPWTLTPLFKILRLQCYIYWQNIHAKNSIRNHITIILQLLFRFVVVVWSLRFTAHNTQRDAYLHRVLSFDSLHCLPEHINSYQETADQWVSEFQSNTRAIPLIPACAAWPASCSSTLFVYRPNGREAQSGDESTTQSATIGVGGPSPDIKHGPVIT